MGSDEHKRGGTDRLLSPAPYWIFLAVSVAYLSAIGVAQLLGVPVDTSEFGPLETSEHVGLFVTTCFWTLSYLTLRRQRPEHRPYSAHFAAFFACVSYLSLGREISWFGVYEVNETLEDTIELVSAGISLVFFVVIAVTWWRGKTGRMREIRTLARAPLVHVLFVSFALIVSADLFEKRLLGRSSFQYYEEALELWGYLAFLVGTIWAWHTARADR